MVRARVCLGFILNVGLFCLKPSVQGCRWRSLRLPFSVLRLMHRGLIFLSVLLILWLSQVNSSLAQEVPAAESDKPAAEQVNPTRSSLGADVISSEKVSQFVRAYLQVVDLIEQREGELQGAETDTESLRVQQEIEAEAFAIIEKAGLTWQEYLQLLGLANTDPEFGERIAAQLQEATY